MATETGVTRPVGRRSWSWSAVLFPVLALLQGGSVFAQTAPTSEPQALEEVVITAEKRVSTVQQTPLSISAVSGDELAALGRVSVADIAEIVPGISMRNSGPGQTEFVMRGLASSAGSGPTVGFYLDEVPLPPAAGSLNGKVVVDPSLYDLSRVEVLRGPQGTLYGSGSMGGTIKLVTTPPQLNVFEGSAHADGSETAGGGINRGGDLALNIPLVQDHVAARIVGTSQYTDGWIEDHLRVEVLLEFIDPEDDDASETYADIIARQRIAMIDGLLSHPKTDVNVQDSEGASTLHRVP